MYMYNYEHVYMHNYRFYVHVHVHVHLLTQVSHSQDTSGMSTAPLNTPPEDADRDRLKKERALRKKLKQIRDLEARIASGEISKPDRDQQAKIAKKSQIEAELLELTEDDGS